MSYQSPITMYTERIVKDIVEKQDAYLVEEVRKVGFDIDKEELAKALKYDRNQYERGYHDGRMYTPPNPTNADRIRAMTDEELARFLYIKTCEDGYPQFDNIPSWLDWLKQEVEE